MLFCHSFLRALNEELPELSKQLDAAETILPPGIRIQTKPVLHVPATSVKVTEGINSSSAKDIAVSPSRAVRVPPPPGRGNVSATVVKEPKPSRRHRRHKSRPTTGNMTRSASASSFNSSRSHASSHSRASERPATPTFTFSRLPRFAPGPGVPAHITSSGKKASTLVSHHKTPPRVIRTTVPLRDEPKPRPQTSRRHTSPAGRRPASRSTSRDSRDSANSAVSRRSHRSVSGVDVQLALLQAQVASLTSQLHERDVLIKKLRKLADKCTCNRSRQGILLNASGYFCLLSPGYL